MSEKKSERFLKFIPSEEAFWLMECKPNAFRLLTHIANTARRYNGHPDGLTIGQCHLRSWTFYKLTEQEYRTAKEILVKRKHIKIIETNRTRKKSTTGVTTNSTLVELCSLTIWDINPEINNDQINDRATTEQRPSNDKQERIRKKKNPLLSEKEKERGEKIDEFILDCENYRFPDEEKLPFSEAILRDFIDEFGLSYVAKSVFLYMKMNKSERRGLTAPSGWLKSKLKSKKEKNE